MLEVSTMLILLASCATGLSCHISFLENTTARLRASRVVMKSSADTAQARPMLLLDTPRRRPQSPHLRLALRAVHSCRKTSPGLLPFRAVSFISLSTFLGAKTCFHFFPSPFLKVFAEGLEVCRQNQHCARNERHRAVGVLYSGRGIASRGHA